MSTYWYFQCLDHTPPLGSDEFTQHTDDEDYQRGIALAAARPLDHAWWDGPQGTYSERNARIFLEAHPRCRLEAVSEYGDRRPLPSSERPETADEKMARLMWDSECTDEWTWAYLAERADRREGDYAEIRDMYLRMVAVARAALLQQQPPHPMVDLLGPWPAALDASITQFRASGGTSAQLSVFARVVAQGRITAAAITELGALGVDLTDPRSTR